MTKSYDYYEELGRKAAQDLIEREKQKQIERAYEIAREAHNEMLTAYQLGSQTDYMQSLEKFNQLNRAYERAMKGI